MIELILNANEKTKLARLLRDCIHRLQAKGTPTVREQSEDVPGSPAATSVGARKLGMNYQYLITEPYDN
ncbi:MAG: hypothetical protein K0Q56_2266 [Sporolactobacillus laevolacticus]|jgi:hypothetical protein|nr:hypothetical protein [Sporolactobacillus laevolacticus]